MTSIQETERSLLVACHRRCCVCHRFCGFKMEIHHIIPRADQGSADRENLIPLCFDCHAEVMLYNDDHPKGRKYTSAELKGHRDQWLDTCCSASVFLASLPVVKDVGPLQGLVNELRYNQAIANHGVGAKFGAVLETAQFLRCLQEEVLSFLEPLATTKIYDAYAAINAFNGSLNAAGQAVDQRNSNLRIKVADQRLASARRSISAALGILDDLLEPNR